MPLRIFLTLLPPWTCLSAPQVAYPVVLVHNLEEPVLGLVGSRTTFWGYVKVTANFLMMKILCCVAISLL